MRLFLDEGSPMAQLLQHALARGITPVYVKSLLAAFHIKKGGQEVVPDSLSPSLLTHPSPPVLLEPLSERELEVLRLISDGQSNEEIARTLFVSMGTVKTHLKHI